MDDIITKSNERVAGFFRTLNEMQVKIEKIIDNSRPPLGGEKFLTDKELSGLLKISRRCLQDYRNQGRIPYIQLGGKILYKASDIEKLLEDNYHKLWNNRTGTAFTGCPPFFVLSLSSFMATSPCRMSGYHLCLLPLSSRCNVRIGKLSASFYHQADCIDSLSYPQV